MFRAQMKSWSMNSIVYQYGITRKQVKIGNIIWWGSGEVVSSAIFMELTQNEMASSIVESHISIHFKATDTVAVL